MRIEAFSEGKDPDRPDANEDRFVVLPGRAYAVIDGVTSRTPARYDGKLSGRYAAELAQRTIEREADGELDGCGLARRIIAAIAKAYVRHGILDAARNEVNLRFSATLALVLDREDHAEITLVGDSGVRVNGTLVHQVEKDLDGITAALRVAAWHLAAQRFGDPALRERISRQVVLHGTRQPAAGVRDWFAPADMDAIEAEAAAACARRYPALPSALVAGQLRGGILNAQKLHQNNAASPLGYSCLDGFAIPDHLITTIRVPRAGLHRVELFTDGYFAPGDGFGVEAWEARFAAIEALDPAKVGSFASVKGSLGRLRADDRTYLGVAFSADSNRS